MTSTAGSIFRRVPRGLGDRAGANLYYRKFLKDKAATSKSARVGNADLSLDLTDWPQAQAFMLRDYDPETVQFVAEHLGERGVFIDGGAHVGLVSLQVAGLRPHARIHSFEPHPQKFAALRRNVDRNAAEIALVNTGLSDSVGNVEFDLDLWTIDGGSTAQDLDLGREPRGPGTMAWIEVTTLDAYLDAQAIDRVDVIKLDIEGHELNALRGAREALGSGRVKAVTMESMHGDTDAPAKYLLDLGFERHEMPDLRPAWLQRRRPLASENAGFLFRT